MFRKRSLLVLLSVAVAVATLSPVAAAENPFPQRGKDATSDVIVVFREGVNPRAQAALLGQAGSKVSFVYDNVFPGLAASLTQRQIAVLRAMPLVRYVEADGVASIDNTWGLDRIDQRFTLSPSATSFSYASGSTKNGEDVIAYVIDTGIRSTHVQFTGRFQAGRDFVGDGRGTEDCNGHGTHVAGTIAGTTYGVATKATVVPVRVLNCRGSGSWSGIIAGVNWVAGQIVEQKAVANMSLGGGTTQALDDAVTSLAAKIPVVVAAGNSNANACNSSPARAPAAITVGATDSKDVRASFSNYGTCVDLFAPGVDVTSAWSSSDTAVNTISGTSMASPHVAGAMALALGDGRTAASVISSVTKGYVINRGPGSPNTLLFTRSDDHSYDLPSAPSDLGATVARNALQLTWTQDTSNPVTTYRLVVSGAGSGTFNLLGSARSMRFTNLKSGSSYTFTLTPANDLGSGLSSVTGTFTTLTR